MSGSVRVLLAAVQAICIQVDTTGYNGLEEC